MPAFLTTNQRKTIVRALEIYGNNNKFAEIKNDINDVLELFMDQGSIYPVVQTSLHITEQKYPEQTKRFREILDEMYQTHLKKNADYSAWNILGTGTIGLTVRFWDKAARLMNLMGFDIGTGIYSGTKKEFVLDESIIDTVNDATVYGIIWRIFSEGKWGR